MRLTTSLFRWGKVVWLCCVQIPRQQSRLPSTPIFLALLTTFWRVAAPTGSITLVSFWGKTCCWLHHTFLLGSPNERVFHVIKLFFWRRCRGDISLLQGEFHASNLFTLFLSCLVYFILSCLLSIIKNTQKISYLHSVYFQFCFLLVIMSGSAHHVLVPEVEIRSFKQQSGESWKDAWYRISDTHRRCTKKIFHYDPA